MTARSRTTRPLASPGSSDAELCPGAGPRRNRIDRGPLLDRALDLRPLPAICTPGRPHLPDPGRAPHRAPVALAPAGRPRRGLVNRDYAKPGRLLRKMRSPLAPSRQRTKRRPPRLLPCAVRELRHFAIYQKTQVLLRQMRSRVERRPHFTGDPRATRTPPPMPLRRPFPPRRDARPSSPALSPLPAPTKASLSPYGADADADAERAARTASRIASMATHTRSVRPSTSRSSTTTHPARLASRTASARSPCWGVQAARIA